MGRGGGGRGGRGRSSGGGAGYTYYGIAAVGAARGVKGSSSASGCSVFDDKSWKEIQWFYQLPYESRCKHGLELLDLCEGNKGFGVPDCEKYRQLIDDCCRKRKPSDGYRCRMGLKFLISCERMLSPDHPQCKKVFDILDGCLLAERLRGKQK